MCLEASGSVRTRAIPHRGELRVAGPDLLALEDPAFVHPEGPGAERRQVGPGARLAEQLAPDVLGVEDPREPTGLLLLGAVDQQGRSHVVDAVAVDRLGSLGARVLHVEDRELQGGGTAPPVALGPVDADPAVRGHPRLPPTSPLEFLLERREGRRRLHVGGQPCPQLVPEDQLVFAQREVHLGSLRSSSRAGRRLRARRTVPPLGPSGHRDRACLRPGAAARRPGTRPRGS